MKVLDVDSFQNGIQRNIVMLQRQRNEIESIFNSVNGLVALEDMLKGEGGDAIREFYAECHLPFLQFFMSFQERFTQVLSSMNEALHSFEPASSGYIVERFLEEEVEQGLQQIAQLTENLTNEANTIMRQVSDIVYLPQLDDSEVQEGVRNAKMKRDNTNAQLYQFDESQTNALTTIEDNLRTMETWISDIEGLFNEGLTDIDFRAAGWAILSVQNKLKMDFALQKTTVGTHRSLTDSNIQLKAMLYAFLASRSPIRFGLQGMVNQPTASWGMSILAFSTLRLKPITENEVNETGKTKDEQLEALYAELAKQPHIDYSLNNAPIDPKTGDYMFTFEGRRRVLGGLGTGTPDGLAPYAAFTFDFFTEDIITMVHPESTEEERALAAAFMFFKPLKAADTGHDLLKAGTKGKSNTISDFAGKINSANIPNMSKKDILDGLPSNWKYTDNNGFVHIKDSNGNVRMRIDPPDKVTKYDHVHIFDENGNPLDIHLNKVDRKSPDAHIPYKKRGD